MWIVIVNVVNTVVLAGVIYLFIPVIKKKKLKDKITQTKMYNKLSGYIFLSVKRKLIPKKINKLNPVILILVMLILFVISFLLFNSYLKVTTTSLILSIPFFISPILIIKILLNKEKGDVIKQLPMYVVNIKNHIEEDNNIIGAIQRTIVEEPLKKYIEVFKYNISRGMNVIEAFDLLKEEVNINLFTTFVNSCEVCYLNGGDFNKVLEHYINMITKENIHKESAKEKAYADILTLIIMAALNVLVIVMFVFTNKEYASIMRETFFGRLVLNFNAVSYIIIAYLVSRIYKEE